MLRSPNIGADLLGILLVVNIVEVDPIGQNQVPTCSSITLRWHPEGEVHEKVEPNPWTLDIHHYVSVMWLGQGRVSDDSFLADTLVVEVPAVGFCGGINLGRVLQDEDREADRQCR